MQSGRTFLITQPKTVMRTDRADSILSFRPWMPSLLNVKFLRRVLKIDFIHLFFAVMKYDFDFWGIDEMFLEPCCALKYYPEMEVCSKV